jgi:PAT family beta-lactamase induction signal transducer AmpG
MAGTFTLAKSTRVRYATGSIMYFAQGIPQGLLAISIPVWLASQGVSAGDIASYLAVIVLPWAFKLVTGPLMDRYEFLAMGRRRPWVIGAQLGLSLSLLALMLVENPAEAATQDVAVDGMAIDLTPVREQGRLNAFMSFGKTIGWAATAAVTGILLTTFGLAVTAIVSSAVAAIGLIVILLVLEREGERTLPWTKGSAATVHRADTSFRAVFQELNKVLWVRTSLIVMAIMFFDGLVYGHDRTGHRSHGRQAHDAAGGFDALRPCTPDLSNPATVGELAIRTGDAVDLGDDVAGRHGYGPCAGDGHLQER